MPSVCPRGKMLGTAEWTRITRFFGEVRVRGGSTESTLSHAQIAGTGEDETYFRVRLGGDMVMRLPKGRFTVGRKADFCAFAKRSRPRGRGRNKKCA